MTAVICVLLAIGTAVNLYICGRLLYYKGYDRGRLDARMAAVDRDIAEELSKATARREEIPHHE